MNYLINKVHLRYGDGRKDTIKGLIKSTDIEKDRVKLREKYNCKTVNFEFIEPQMLPDDYFIHPNTKKAIDNICEC